MAQPMEKWEPHSLSVGGGNAPIRCLPNAWSSIKEEAIAVITTGRKVAMIRYQNSLLLPCKLKMKKKTKKN